MTSTSDAAGRIDRERDYWDHVVPTVEESLKLYEKGPNPNTKRMLDAVDPESGPRVIDFACGAGVHSAWLAARGAKVTGVDLSPNSIKVAKEVAERLGLDIEFLVADVETMELPDGGYDAMIGHWALHHLDTKHMAPVLARAIKPGGVAAFEETMALNPVLRFARNNIVGRFGIKRVGTLDEHPLGEWDLEQFRNAFGELEVVTEWYKFFQLFDRAVLHHRYPKATRAIRKIDDRLAKWPKTADWGYHQVLILRRVPEKAS
jgi:SAM-dependent methyltransferase